MTDRVCGLTLSWLHLALAMRPHHWVKNTIVFAPLVLSGNELNSSAWWQSSIAFIAMCLVASAGYLFNDVIDVADDRNHPNKKTRIVAAGRISPAFALRAAIVTGTTGLLVGAILGPVVCLVLGAYFILSVFYSLHLKSIRILDCVALALFFEFRAFVGAYAIGVPVSLWLILFLATFFFSLALSKRLDEMVYRDGQTDRRNYKKADQDLVLGSGGLSALSSVLVVLIYVAVPSFNPEFYLRSTIVWLFPVTIGIFLARIWTEAAGGRLYGDPVMFALRDPVSLLAGATITIAFIAARGGLG